MFYKETEMDEFSILFIDTYKLKRMRNHIFALDLFSA